ncbi:MAG: hypothetical protein RBR74_11880, partial [Ignavibacteriaceae bacterium]|nr:hypothetical protein [Ignavibacteriaceae bacterium]
MKDVSTKIKLGIKIICMNIFNNVLIRVFLAVLLGLLSIIAAVSCDDDVENPLTPKVRYYGTLMSDTLNAASQVEKGIKCVSLTVSWNMFEPQEGVVFEHYAEEIEKKIRKFKKDSALIVLDFGLHYPPGWATSLQNSRYVNQFGDAYVLTDQPGRNVVNGVFNRVVREKMAAYIGRVFERFGAENFFAVRVGGGYWAELHYPDNEFNGKKQCFWGYDDIATGKVTGMLPDGVTPNPVPDWKPGEASPNNESARQFINWYISSLSNYQNFQIATIREYFDGLLNILYADWGARPGQIEDAIKANLDGTAFADFYGQLAKGHAPQQHIEALPQDTNLVAYTTSFNAIHPWSSTENFVNENSKDPKDWSPVHFLSWCAANHNPKLKVWGENSGNNPYMQMKLIFNRIAAFNVMG